MASLPSLSSKTHLTPKPDLSGRESGLKNYGRNIGLEGREKMWVAEDRALLGNWLGKNAPITHSTPLAHRNIGPGAWQDHAFYQWKQIPGNENHTLKEWGDAFKKVYPEHAHATKGHDAGVGGKVLDWIGDSMRNLTEATGTPKVLEDVGRGTADVFGASDITKETVGGAFAMLPGMMIDIFSPTKLTKLATVGKGGKVFTGAKSWVPPVAPVGKAKRLAPFTGLSSVGARSTISGNRAMAGAFKPLPGISAGLSPFQATKLAQVGTGAMMGTRTYSDTHSPFMSLGMGAAGGTIPNMMNIGGQIGAKVASRIGGKPLLNLAQQNTMGITQRQLVAEQIGANTIGHTVGQKLAEWSGKQVGAFAGFELAGEGGALLDKGWKQYHAESPWHQGGEALKQHMLANTILQLPFVALDPVPNFRYSLGLRVKPNIVKVGEQYEHHAFNKGADLKDVIELAKPIHPEGKFTSTKELVKDIYLTEDKTLTETVQVNPFGMQRGRAGKYTFGKSGLIYPTDLADATRSAIASGVFHEGQLRSKQLEQDFINREILNEFGEPDAQQHTLRQARLNANLHRVLGQIGTRPMEEMTSTLFGDILKEPTPIAEGAGKREHTENLTLMSEFKNKDPDTILSAHRQITVANDLLAQQGLPPLTDAAINSSLTGHEAQGTNVKEGAQRTVQAHKNRADEVSKKSEFPTDVVYGETRPEAPVFATRGPIMKDAVIDGLELDIFPMRPDTMTGVDDPAMANNPQQLKGSWEVVAIHDAMEAAQALGYKYQIVFRNRTKGQRELELGFTKKDVDPGWLEATIYYPNLHKHEDYISPSRYNRPAYETGAGQSEITGDSFSPFLGTIQPPYTVGRSKGVVKGEGKGQQKPAELTVAKDEKLSADGHKGADDSTGAIVGESGDKPLQMAVARMTARVVFPTREQHINSEAERAAGMPKVPFTKVQKSTQERYNELGRNFEENLLTGEQLGSYTKGKKMVDDAIDQANTTVPKIDTFIQQAQKLFINWYESGRVDGATFHSPSLGYLHNMLKGLVGTKGSGLEKMDFELQHGHSVEGRGKEMEFENKRAAELSAERAQRKHQEDWNFSVVKKTPADGTTHWRVRVQGKVEKKVIQDENGEEMLSSVKDLTGEKSLIAEAEFDAVFLSHDQRYTAHLEQSETGARLRTALMEAYNRTPGAEYVANAWVLIERLQAYKNFSINSGRSDRQTDRKTEEKGFTLKGYSEMNNLMSGEGKFKKKDGVRFEEQMKTFFRGDNRVHVERAVAQLLNENTPGDGQYHYRDLGQKRAETEDTFYTHALKDIRPGDRFGSIQVDANGWVNRIKFLQVVTDMHMPAHEKNFFTHFAQREGGENINMVELGKLMRGKEGLYAKPEITQTADGTVLAVIDPNQAGTGLRSLGEVKLSKAQEITNAKTGKTMGEAVALDSFTSKVAEENSRIEKAVSKQTKGKVTVKELIDNPTTPEGVHVRIRATNRLGGVLTGDLNIRKLFPLDTDYADTLHRSENVYLVEVPGMDGPQVYYDHVLTHSNSAEVYAMKAALNTAKAQNRPHIVVTDPAQYDTMSVLTQAEGTAVKLADGKTGKAYKVAPIRDSQMQLDVFHRPDTLPKDNRWEHSAAHLQAQHQSNVEVTSVPTPAFEGLADFLYRTGRRLGLRDAELGAHIEAGLNIATLYPKLLQGMEHAEITGPAHGAHSPGRNGIYTNIQSRVEAGSPMLARFLVGHEMGHAWRTAHKYGKLDAQQTKVINTFYRALTDVAPEQNRLVIQEALTLVPKEFRADLQKDIDSSKDPYTNPEETMAHLTGVLALAVTTPKSRGRIKDFLTFMPSQISDGVQAMLRFMRDGVNLFREYGRWAAKGLVRGESLNPQLKSAMEEMHSQMKTLSKVQNELSQAEQQFMQMVTLDPAGAKAHLKQLKDNPNAAKFVPDPTAAPEVNDMVFQMKKVLGQNPTDKLYKASKADRKRLKQMTGELAKGDALLRQFSNWFEPADQLAARRPHLANLIGLMSKVSMTAKESIASIHSAGMIKHVNGEFLPATDFKHMQPVTSGKGKTFKLFNEIARWQQEEGELQVWHHFSENAHGERVYNYESDSHSRFLRQKFEKLKPSDQDALLAALEGMTRMKNYETAIQTNARAENNQAWIADELMGLLNNSSDTLHPMEAFDTARDVWNLAMIQSTPADKLSMNQMQQAQQLQGHLLKRLAPEREGGEAGLSKSDRLTYDTIMENAVKAAEAHKAFVQQKLTSPGHMSEIRYGKYAYRFTKDGKTGMVAGRTKKEAKDMLLRATKGKYETATPFRAREKDFAEISNKVMQTVSAQEITNKQQLAAHLENITLPGGLKASDLVGDLDAFFDAGHQLRKERLARDIALPGIKRGYALGREQMNMWQNQLDHFNASTKNAAMSIMNAHETVHLKDPNIVADPLHMKQVQTMLENFRRPDTLAGTSIVKGIFTYFLGFNLSSHALESMQAGFSITPNLTAMGAGVVGGNKLVAQAAGQILKYHLPRGTKAVGMAVGTLGKRKLKPEAGTYGDAEADAAMAYFHKMQLVDNLGAAQEVIDGQTTIDARQLNTPEALTPKSIALNTLKYPISALHGSGVRLYKVTTNFNARIALLAGFNHFRNQKLQGQKRKLTKGELQEVYDETAKFNLLVNFSGGKATRPGTFFSGQGDNGRTAAQTLYALQSYTAGMTATYGRFMEAAFKGAEARPDLSPRQRADHRKAVMQLFTTQLLAAGAVGLPFVGQMLAILGQMGWDVKKTIREELGGVAQALLDDDERARVVTDMAMYGVMNEFLPADVGSRFALGGVMGVSNYEGATLAGSLGPVGKLAEEGFSAASELIKSAKEPDSFGAKYGGLQGRGLRAVQHVVPQGMKNSMKQIRNRGNIVSDYSSLYFEDQTPWETIGNATGFVPGRVAHNRRYDAYIRSAKKSAMDSDQQFIRQVAEVYKAGRLNEARTLIRERAAREPGYTVESGASAVGRYIEKNTIGQDLRLKTDRRTAGAMNRLLSLQRHLPESSQLHRYGTRKRAERLLGLPDQGQLRTRGMNQALMMDLMGENYPRLQKPQTQWRVQSEFPNP